jgi:hypothetical protein
VAECHAARVDLEDSRPGRLVGLVHREDRKDTGLDADRCLGFLLEERAIGIDGSRRNLDFSNANHHLLPLRGKKRGSEEV